MGFVDDPDDTTEEDYRQMTPKQLCKEIKRREKHPGMHHCFCMFFREGEGKAVYRLGPDDKNPWIFDRIQEPVGYCGECGGTGWCY